MIRRLLFAIAKLLQDPPGEPPRRRAERFFFLLTLVIDLFMIGGGLAAAVSTREGFALLGFSRGPAAGFIYTHFVAALIYYLVALFIAFKYVDVFRDRRFLTGNREAGRIAKAVFAFTLANMVLAFLFPTRLLFSRLTLVFSFLFITGLVLLGRYGVRLLRRTLREIDLDMQVAVILGDNATAALLAAELTHATRHGYRLAGLLRTDGDGRGHLDGVRILGGLDRLERVVRRLRVSEVFLCEPGWSAHAIMEIFSRLRPLGVRIRVVSNLFNVIIERVGVPVDAIGDTPILDFGGLGIRGWRRHAKRALDVAVSLTLLVLTFPLWALVALAIYAESGGPVLYKQKRVGQDGRRFSCYKFRTMVQSADHLQQTLADRNEVSGPMFKIRDDPRVTRVGRVLRRYSLDELPQLWNILRGDMSLVGPRPPLPQEVEQYEPWHRKRLAGPMGLTGLWQVSGRNELDFEDMALLDIYYLRNHSLFLDYRILVRTIFTVLLGQGR